ncbi:MAG: AAA family ATPase, partial [Nanoarchaeota archaeon]
MQLRKIFWRNIGPYGNKLQEIEFSKEGGLWMVLGKNGHGKSFLVNLPKILYYGKLDKFKKDDIANRLNKHGWIKGEIQVNPQTFVSIERKMSPSDLKVYKYGKDEIQEEEHDIGKAGISNYQDYIDTEVTGLPYHIFSNIISLSVNEFKSFISMTPNDKRIIIDKLFSMEVLNKMNSLVRNDLRDIKINIDLFDREISSLNSTIKTATKELESL